MLHRAVARAISQTLAKDEATDSDKARQALAEELYEFALRLQRHVGVDASDIFEVAQALREGRLT